MASKRVASNDDSSSDISSSTVSNIHGHNFHHSNGRKQTQNLKEISQNVPKIGKSRPYKKPPKITPLSSDETHTSLGSGHTSNTRSSTLNNTQKEKFQQRIKEEYEGLQIAEAHHRYYITDIALIREAREELEKSPDGTYFVRPAKEAEETSNVKYFLNFVCHKRVAEVPLCCDASHRSFWFLSGCGHGSEVRQVYTGIDVLIQHKKKNTFSELQYPFRICLYKPITDKLSKPLNLLPDEVRAMAGQNTILHELATQGLTEYFNELIRISSNDVHLLQQNAQLIVKKINGRNKQGQTPLILAIQAKQDKFIDILLDNGVDVDRTDTQGCSPLHYACQQANSKLLQKLILRGADPHYVNQKQYEDGNRPWNLSAFHYLAMAKGATAKEIKHCAMYLIEKGCPLMPLTSGGKSPFDIAEIHNNNAYKCVQMFCRRYEFNDVTPIEVSSRNEAKTILSDLACPSILGKLRVRIKQYDNSSCCGMDGLFSYFKVRKSRYQENDELGLCVYHAGQVLLYPISSKHICTVRNSNDDSPLEIRYQYSLKTDTIKDDQAQVILFRRCEELIYNYTKYKGILPISLKSFVQKKDGNIEIMEAATLLVPNGQSSELIDDYDDNGGNEVEDEPSDTEEDIDVDSIDHFDISQILSIKLLHENQRRFIWSGKVQLDPIRTFSIIIKDYLPSKDMDSYKQYRLNEFHPTSRDQSHTTNDQSLYEFSSRTRLEYKHESKFLLKQLKNHPFIVHTFTCNHNLRKDYRIFMECLPLGNLHTRLTRLNQTSLEPLADAFHWIYQLAQVMAFLSKKSIVHRDLAARNILLRNETHIKLSDFGLSRVQGFSSEGKDCVLPPRWTAPECFDPRYKALSSSDVWSFGIVIWEIYSFGALPYEADTKRSVQQIIPLLKRYLIEQGRRLSRPDRCSEGMYDLMYRCWNLNNDKRPCFADIINELNGIGAKKECITGFSRAEKKAWEKAKIEYLEIFEPYQTASSDANEYIDVQDNEYIGVQDNENDDNGNIYTVL